MKGKGWKRRHSRKKIFTKFAEVEQRGYAWIYIP